MAPGSAGCWGLEGLGGVAPRGPAPSPPHHALGELRGAIDLRPPMRPGVALVAVEGEVAPAGDPWSSAAVLAGTELPLPQVPLLEPGPASPPSLAPE